MVWNKENEIELNRYLIISRGNLCIFRMFMAHQEIFLGGRCVRNHKLGIK